MTPRNVPRVKLRTITKKAKHKVEIPLWMSVDRARTFQLEISDQLTNDDIASQGTSRGREPNRVNSGSVAFNSDRCLSLMEEVDEEIRDSCYSESERIKTPLIAPKAEDIPLGVIKSVGRLSSASLSDSLRHFSRKALVQA